MKHLAATLFAIIVALNPPQAGKTIAKRAGAPAPTKLTLLYTSSARGQIRSCNCTKFRFGGYGRELTLLKSIRKDTPDTVLVEGGDCVQWTGFQGDLKLEVTKKALGMLGYDAMVPGEDELGRSGHRLIDGFDPKAVPIICANLKAEEGDGLSFPPDTVVKTKGGLRVGLMGLLDQDIGKLFQEKFLADAISDPLAALNSHVTKLRSRCDLVVVIFHGSAKKAEKLARVKGVDLILATHRVSRDVLFPAKGENVVKAPTKIVDGVVIVNAETKTNWSLGRIDLDLTERRKIGLAKHSVIYLDRRYDEDPKMVEVYENYNNNVKTAVLAQSTKIKNDMEAVLTKRGLNVARMRERLHKSPFATVDTCKTCHSDICESWAKTRHATAVATLEKTHQDYDPECVGCHVTGASTRNGFQNMKDTPKLANVQCESCHGPGVSHAAKPAKGYGHVSEQMCRSCHTNERTPDFDYESSQAKIKH